MEERRQREEREEREEQEFKALIRVLFKFIKAYHHNLGMMGAGNEEGPPAKLQRMACSMSAGIQPAFPSVNTKWLIYGNAKNWLNNSLDILKEHHEQALVEASQAVFLASRVRWREAWEIAAKWARRGLRTLRESTVRQAFTEASRISAGEEGDDDGGETSGYVPRKGEERAGPSSSSKVGQVKPRGEEAQGSQAVVGAPKVRRKIARKCAVKWPQPAGEKSTQGSSVPKARILVLSRPAQKKGGPQTTVVRPSTVSVSVPGPTEATVGEREPVGGAPAPAVEPVRGGQPVQAQDSADLGDSPRYRLEEEQEQVCLRVEAPKVAKAKKGLGLGLGSRSRAVGVLPVGPVLPSLPALPSLTPVRVQGQDQAEPMEVGDSLDSDIEWILGASQEEVPQEVEAGAATQTGKKGPGKSLHVRHEVVGGDKYKSWSLAPGREILIVGDSNLGRIPEVNNGAVEVHSYPGATLSQAFSLIKYKTPAADGVRHVILSFGLNDRGQSNVQALRKCVDRLKEAAAATFPNAVLHIPLVNYDSRLPEQQVRNLRALNDVIFRAQCCVPLLPGSRFQVEQDLIHWTEDTARVMLQHWMRHLNY